MSFRLAPLHSHQPHLANVYISYSALASVCLLQLQLRISYLLNFVIVLLLHAVECYCGPKHLCNSRYCGDMYGI